MTIKVIVSGGAAAASKEHVPELVLDKVASRLFDKDHTLWGKDAESEATIRLGWVDAASKSLELVPEVEALRRELLSRGLTRVVLCGMGGSSLAPEVITKTFGKELVVLDSTDPTQVRQALEADLASTVVVVSSKSGSTVETDSQKRSFEQAFDDAGIEKTDRIFIVTDPDSPMHRQAIKDGYRVFLADPMVGGRYSALTAFGVVPSVLAGVDVTPVLEDAISASLSMRQDDPKNPGLVLGSVLARTRMSSGFKDKVGIVSSESGIVGFGDWAEQLIAESTGKIGRGVLPVVLEKSSIELTIRNQDILVIELSADASQSHEEVVVSATLGEQLILWEVATVIASRLLGVNPFDQPDVESAKIAARAMLDSPASKSVFTFEDGSISGATLGFSASASDLEFALDGLFEQAQSDSYIAIHCYLNRESMGEVVALRDLIALKTGRPTTFGWGPRFLHSTGQYHKGGPKQGVFLQLVSGSLDDLAIQGRQFGYRQLIQSQASGDAKVLADKGSPVLVLQLSNPVEGIDRLIGILS
jgi:glucose-6-phosphate isomerase